jgi:hypothetical protein
MHSAPDKINGIVGGKLKEAKLMGQLRELKEKHS